LSVKDSHKSALPELGRNFVRLGFKLGDFPAAERYYAGAISLPLFPAMASEEQDRVVDTLQRALS
jgi:dTDP-4-amino-4,6-dideoxygalactose transaminase